MWRPPTRVVAAVSGGSDSVALLHLLHDLHRGGELVLDAVAHFNHQTRAAASDDDEAFCRELAAHLAIPFECECDDVPQRANERGVSIEVAARDLRHTFLERVRRRRAADRIATAHTRDDQAETVVLRALRGAGLRGLGGIAPTRDSRIRPLLLCSRDELRDDLRVRGQAWREDATNADLANPRNRVRHEVLPYLEAHFNPSARQALARLADLARADDDALRREAAVAAVHLVHSDEVATRVNAAALNALPEALARRVVQHALEHFGDAAPGLADIDNVLAVAAGELVATEVFGVRAEHSGGSVVLMRRGVDTTPPGFCLDLTIPGAVEIPGRRVVEALRAGLPSAEQQPEPGVESSEQVTIDADGVGTALVVRNRRPGDRVRPLGLGGHKKLQDLFVDRKVSRWERDHVPVITDARGRIVWVVGHALGEDFRVTARTTGVIILKLRRI